MNILAGPVGAFRALGLMFANPSLFLLAAIPGLVTALVSMLAIWLSVALGADMLTVLWPEPSGGSVLWDVVAWVLRLSTALLSVFITPWLVMLVGFPLCEPLAVKIEALVGGEVKEGRFLADLLQALKATVGVTLIGLSGSVAFFVLGLIPGVALFTTPFVFFVWTPLFLAFDLFDGSLSRRQVPFSKKLTFLRGQLITACSVGLTGTALIAVPILNLIGLPVAVAMAVLVIRDLEQAGRLPA